MAQSASIHGGRRLSGRIAVEGNKNAALPLLAACLLTAETCEIAQRAADPRRRRHDRPAAIARRRGRGRGHADAARHVPATSRRPSQTRSWSAACADRCCCWARCSGGPAARCSRRPAAIFRRGGRSRRTCARCARWARASSNDAGRHRLEAPDGLTGASMYLLEASVTGTETALLAAARATGVTEIRNAACEPHVAELCEFLRGDGRGRRRASARRRSASRRRARLRGATHTLRGDYIEAASWAVVGAITGGDVEVAGAHGRRTSSPSTAVLAEMGVDVRARGRPLRRACRPRSSGRGASRPASGRASRATSSVS